MIILHRETVYFRPIRMATFKKKKIYIYIYYNRCWQGCEEIGSIVYHCWDFEMIHLLWKGVCNFLEK